MSSAAELEVIQQRGYLIVAVKDNLRPMGFIDAEGQLVGFEVDVARRLAEALFGQADAVVFQPVSNRDRLAVVLDNEVDVAIASVTATGPRYRVVNFSTPYYLDGTTLIARDIAIQTLSDLAQRPVAILNGSSAIASVRASLPGAVLVGVESYQAARSLLESNQVSAFAGDASVLAGWVQEHPAYRLLPDILSAEPLAVVMPKGIDYDPLRRQVSALIDSWIQEGWLQERAAYWGLPQYRNE
ncbi:MAG: transporter substrate-binding domain-containing protein [Cyanothece sp. SIO1E1]|nr:transporter substrate-binding domain-containing protein [Cyanothece sp. SIO1E1]